MSFYLVHVNTDFGPGNWPIIVDCHEEHNTISKAVAQEAMLRSVRIKDDWSAQPVDEYEFRNLAGING